MKVPPGQISLRAVAAKAGVSQATASRALKNDPRISEAVRKKIQRVADELGYKPDPQMGKLMAYMRTMQESRFQSTLGFILPPHPYPNEYGRLMFKGAKERALALGYAVDRFSTPLDAPDIAQLNRVLSARGIEGLLLFPRIGQEAPPATLDVPKFAVVSCATFTGDFPVHRVMPAHFENASLVFDEAARRKFKRPGLVTFKDFNRRQRQAGPMAYYRFCHEILHKAPLPVFDWTGTPSDIESRFIAWFSDTRPDSLIVVGDLIQDAISGILGKRKSLPPMIGIGHTIDDHSGIDEKPGVIGSSAVDLLTAHVVRNEKGWPTDVKLVSVPGRLHC